MHFNGVECAVDDCGRFMSFCLAGTTYGAEQLANAAKMAIGKMVREIG